MGHTRLHVFSSVPGNSIGKVHPWNDRKSKVCRVTVLLLHCTYVYGVCQKITPVEQCEIYLLSTEITKNI